MSMALGGDSYGAAVGVREQIGKQNLHKYGSSDESMTKLSSAALSSVTSTGSVETFPLVRPSSTNKFEGVYIYLDEVGMLKHVREFTITFHDSVELIVLKIETNSYRAIRERPNLLLSAVTARLLIVSIL